jgi:hypothetical protein
VSISLCFTRLQREIQNSKNPETNMKKILSAFMAIGFTAAMAQQAPQGLNYQAVARTASGLIIPTQNVNVRFTILTGSVTGTVVYQETHSTSTNNFGLFTLSIGRGTVVSGNFAAIDWGGADKFLRVEIAADGTSNYTVQGTTQFLSVPYSLYSERTRLLAGNNTINITGGNTITGNYQAGAGVNIAGNVISSPGSTLWVPDANGIHNAAGNVGIGTNSASGSKLTIQQVATGGFSGALDLVSNDTWHTVMRFRNTTVNQEWQLMVGGSGNTDQLPATLGIFNTRNNRWPFFSDAFTNNVGIGSYTIDMPLPRSRLHVFNGDVNIDQIGNGIIMKSPNGQCWRVTVNNSGNLVTTSITCP